MSYGTAFFAGLVSFLSPCVLPLVPGYISFMSGLSLEELQAGRRGKAGLASIGFVLGFSLVFTALGATASAIGGLLAVHAAWLTKVAGVVIILFGLHTAGILPIKWLYYQKRADASRLPPGFGGACVMGMAFAFGWTPCIGPILAGILALAATQESVYRGMGLLLVYSLGLGLPFLITGFAINLFLAFFANYKRHIVWGERAAGALLVGVGILILQNKLTWLIGLLPQSLQRFAL
jgi:cytochrome c-type biogenesis protein